MKDSQIIELFWQRSEKALNELAAKYGRLLAYVARTVLRNEADIAECLNDTYMAVWQMIPPERPKSLKAYICKIARNTALNKVRYNTAAKRDDSLDTALEELENILPDNSSRPDLNVQANELSAAINKFLASINKKDRLLFVKRHYFGMSIGQIAAEAGMTENNTSVRLSRIRSALAEFLREEGLYNE